MSTESQERIVQTFYSIKYLEGIESFQGVLGKDGYVEKKIGFALWRYERLGKQCFRTFEEAKSAALIEMDSKIANAEARLERLRALNAEIEKAVRPNE